MIGTLSGGHTTRKARFPYQNRPESRRDQRKSSRVITSALSILFVGKIKSLLESLPPLPGTATGGEQWGFWASIKQTSQHTDRRQCPGFRVQGGTSCRCGADVLADLSDHHRAFDAGEYHHSAAAFTTGSISILKTRFKRCTQAFVTRCSAGVLQFIGYLGGVPLAPLRRCDQCTVPTVRRKDTVGGASRYGVLNW